MGGAGVQSPVCSLQTSSMSSTSQLLRKNFRPHLQSTEAEFALQQVSQVIFVHILQVLVSNYRQVRVPGLNLVFILALPAH